MKKPKDFCVGFIGNLKKRYIFILYFVLIVLITLYSYEKLPQLYYLNDEWLSMAGIYTDGLKSTIVNFSVFELLMGKGRLLGSLLINVFYYYFPFNLLPFALTSYVFHIVNGLLVFGLLKKCNKNTFIAVFSGLFFVTASIANQAFTWIANVTQVPTSTTCILLSVWFMMMYSKNEEKRYYILSWAFGYLAFLFKDASFYIFIFLPVFQYLISKGRQSVIKILKSNLLLILPMVALGVYRMISMYGKNIVLTASDSTGSFWLKFLFNSVFYPFISLSQTFIPPKYMFRMAERFLNFNYSNIAAYINSAGVISENIISDFLSVVFSFFLSITIGVAYATNKKQQKTLLIALLFYVLSFVPISVYLSQRGTAYVESRYVYASIIPIGIMTAIILDTFRKRFTKTLPKLLVTAIIVAGSVLYFYKQVVLIRRDVYLNVIYGQDTKQVLTEFSRLLPTLPSKSVIYLTGNTNYYNYMNHPVPLQLDPGYILMVWYYKSGNVPDSLLPVSRRLWGFGSQWYEESSGKGFGYYWDKELLLQDYNDKKFSAGQVIGFSYDGSSKRLTDISKEIQLFLTNNGSGQ